MASLLTSSFLSAAAATASGLQLRSRATPGAAGPSPSSRSINLSAAPRSTGAAAKVTFPRRQPSRSVVMAFAAANDDAQAEAPAKSNTKTEGEQPKSGPSKNDEARKQLQRAFDGGEKVAGKVEMVNRGGLLLRIINGRFRAFLPMSQMRSSRLNFGGETGVKALEQQVGKVIEVKVTDLSNKRVVVSEKQVVQEAGLKSIKVGQKCDAVVTSLSDFGAFVELMQTAGPAEGLEGMVHISELSWDRIGHPRDVLQIGDEVDVKVLDVNKESGRINFSVKQLQADPLLETLDTIMPVVMPEGSIDEGDEDLLESPLPGLLDICSSLLGEDGIEAVIPGRQAVEKRVVSQDLELWLTNITVEDGYNLLARAGRQVQEIHVVTQLDRDSIKLAIKRATSAVK